MIQYLTHKIQNTKSKYNSVFHT